MCSVWWRLVNYKFVMLSKNPVHLSIFCYHFPVISCCHSMSSVWQLTRALQHSFLRLFFSTDSVCSVLCLSVLTPHVPMPPLLCLCRWVLYHEVPRCSCSAGDGVCGAPLACLHSACLICYICTAMTFSGLLLV